MIDGLIISEDKNLFDEINLSIDTDISYFEYADSLAMAKKRIELDAFDYIILIEKGPEKVIQLMTDLKKIKEFAETPVVCCTADITPDQRLQVWQQGAKDVFEFPVLREEFKLRLGHFFKEIAQFDTDEQTYGMQGKLEDYNLLDIVQTMEQNKKTGLLTLYHSRDEGKIWFYKGKICDAQFRKSENIDAVFKLATWMEGDFTISFTDEEYENKIIEENRQVLIDALGYIDKRDNIIESLPDIHEVLLISPETDLQVLDDEDLSLLKFFQGGQTIAAYLSTFEMDELILLEKMSNFIEKNLLMTRAQFDGHVTEQEKEIGDAGIKKVFKKIFKSRQPAPENGQSEMAAEAEEAIANSEFVSPDHSTSKLDAGFNVNKVEIDKIRAALEKL